MTERTRRSISVKGVTHQRLKDYCDAQKKTVSGCLEEIVAEKLDAAGCPVPTELRPKPKKPKKPKEPKEPDPEEEIISQHFTF